MSTFLKLSAASGFKSSVFFKKPQEIYQSKSTALTFVFSRKLYEAGKIASGV